MKITSIGHGNNFNQSFGTGFDVTTSGIQSRARFDSFRRDAAKATSKKYEARISRIKNMYPDYSITASLEYDKHSAIGDFYRFSIGPSQCNKKCAKLLKNIKADTPALVIMAQLERALKKIKL